MSAKRLVLCVAVLALLTGLGACRAAEPDTPAPPEPTSVSTPGLSSGRRLDRTPTRTPRPAVSYSEVRPAAVADAFYPGDAGQAAAMVHQYLDPLPAVDGEPIALIVPHAGWVYSGHVAAVAYKQIEGFSYDAIVILGPNHTDPTFDAISVYAEGAFETPSGPMPIDEALAAQLLAAHARIVFERDVHAREHSIEVQLPFLQRVCPDCAFVPVVIGAPTAENLDLLTEALVSVLRGKKALVIASSDLSHYATYDDALTVDATTLAAIETLDASAVSAALSTQMTQGVPGLVTCACGEGPILVAMRVAEALGADRVRVLKYANSGDVGGDLSRVVGYAAVMFWRWAPPDLNAAQQRELLALARHSIETYLATGERAALAPPADPALNRRLGAFVTLTQKDDPSTDLGASLRGCVGHTHAADPLYQTVARAAVDAGVNDPRFPPLTLADMEHIGIEISVLAPFKRVRDVHSEAEIEVGRHGLYLFYGKQRGILLPQVPVEQGWDRDEYLEQICAKAGLSTGCWEQATLYTFEAQVFGE